MLYSNKEMALEGWLGGTATGQRRAGGGKETGLRALGERPSLATVGGQLPSTSPTCSCDGKERSWDVMRVFCNLPCHKRARCSNTSGGFNINPWGTVVVVIRGRREGRIW